MPEAKHTDLPWIATYTADSVSIETRIGGKLYTLIEIEYGAAAKGVIEAMQANAAFIVRACNAHYELVEACEEAINLCALITNRWATGAKNSQIHKVSKVLEQALAKAKE